VSTEEWTREIGPADPLGTEDEDDEPVVSVQLRSGGGAISWMPSPEALRGLAAALVDGADALEGK
jgi:hypothetical protein